MIKAVFILIIGATACFSMKNDEPKERKYIFNIKYDSLAYAKSKDTITYKPGVTLNWSDFKGKPKQRTNVVAISSVGFKYNANFYQSAEKTEINISIAAFFVRPNSWKLADVSNYILDHEQRHFDIARIGAELLRQNLKNRKLTEDNFQAELQKAYNEAWEQYKALQKEYDAQTSHSQNKQQQALWTKKVADLLDTCVY